MITAPLIGPFAWWQPLAAALLIGPRANGGKGDRDGEEEGKPAADTLTPIASAAQNLLTTVSVFLCVNVCVRVCLCACVCVYVCVCV